MIRPNNGPFWSIEILQSLFLFSFCPRNRIATYGRRVEEAPRRKEGLHPINLYNKIMNVKLEKSSFRLYFNTLIVLIIIIKNLDSIKPKLSNVGIPWITCSCNDELISWFSRTTTLFSDLSDGKFDCNVVLSRRPSLIVFVGRRLSSSGNQEGPGDNDSTITRNEGTRVRGPTKSRTHMTVCVTNLTSAIPPWSTTSFVWGCDSAKDPCYPQINNRCQVSSLLGRKCERVSSQVSDQRQEGIPGHQ